MKVSSYSFVLLKAQAAFSDSVIFSLVEKLHLRRDEFPVAHRVARRVEHPRRGFGVVVSVVHTELDHIPHLLLFSADHMPRVMP